MSDLSDKPGPQPAPAAEQPVRVSLPVPHRQLMTEPGLISRTWFQADRGRIIVEERWNLDAPGCPHIRSPFHNPLHPGPIYVQQLEMTEQEFEQLNPVLK